MLLLFLSVAIGLSRILDWLRLTSVFLFVGNASKFEELLLGMYFSRISFILVFVELCCYYYYYDDYK